MVFGSGLAAAKHQKPLPPILMNILPTFVKYAQMHTPYCPIHQARNIIINHASGFRPKQVQMA
jgi:hypothetical protein